MNLLRKLQELTYGFHAARRDLDVYLDTHRACNHIWKYHYQEGDYFVRAANLWQEASTKCCTPKGEAQCLKEMRSNLQCQERVHRNAEKLQQRALETWGKPPLKRRCRQWVSNLFNRKKNETKEHS